MKKIINAVMLLLGLSILNSCEKPEIGEANGLVGNSFLLTIAEYIFNGEVVESFAIDYSDVQKLNFITNEEVKATSCEGIVLEYTYSYDKSTGEISIPQFDGYYGNTTLTFKNNVLSACEYPFEFKSIKDIEFPIRVAGYQFFGIEKVDGEFLFYFGDTGFVGGISIEKLFVEKFHGQSIYKFPVDDCYFYINKMDEIVFVKKNEDYLYEKIIYSFKKN